MPRRRALEQVPLGTELPRLTPLASLSAPPDRLADHAGFQYERAIDDLGPHRWALVRVGSADTVFMLMAYDDDPYGGVQVIGPTDSRVGGELDRLLRALGVEKEEVLDRVPQGELPDAERIKTTRRSSVAPKRPTATTKASTAADMRRVGKTSVRRGRPGKASQATSSGLTKSEFVDQVAAESGLGKGEAAQAVDAVLKTIEDALKQGSEVSFSGFGKFAVAERGPRHAVHPRTGQTIQIAASKVPKFTAGSVMKKALQDSGN